MQLSSCEKLNPIDAWSIFVACKLHFTPGKNYNAFEFNFKGPRCKRETFMKMGQRHHYERLAKQFHNRDSAIYYVVANIINGKSWIGDMNSEDYEIWLGKLQNLDYNFRSDMSKVRDVESNFNIAICPQDTTQIPTIYRLYRSGEISLETLACLESLLGFSRDLDKKLSDPLEISRNLSHLIRAYSPFLSSRFNKKKYREIIVSLFTKQQN
jgi:hypothetical protein